MMVNLWKENLAIGSRSNSSRNSTTVPERGSCMSSFSLPAAFAFEALMRVQVSLDWNSTGAPGFRSQAVHQQVASPPRELSVISSADENVILSNCW